MNAVSGTDQPPEGMVSSHNASRRTFLKGVGLAGAAGLAAPLLARTSARAGITGIVLGVQAPGPFKNTPTWPNAVAGAVGCRSYLDTPFKNAADFAGTTFPGEPGTKVVASIRPDPTNLLKGDFDTVIMDFIGTGMTSAKAGSISAPQLTAWHEAGNLYTDPTKWGAYDLSPQTVRSMHVHMKNLCDQVAAANPTFPRVDYGCIIYGVISQMASDTDPTHNWVPGVLPDLSKYPMDWYGIDVYYEGDPPNTGSNTPHPDLATYDLVSQYMGGFLTMARNRSGLTWPKINVCECNANATDFAARPGFFENLAKWLFNNGGRRMLTFFPDGGGPHSVAWPPIEGTIDALNYIQATYG